MRAADSLKVVYLREVESKPYNYFIIVIAFLIFNIVIFGVFGSFLGYRALSEKIALRSQYVIAKENLTNNLATAESLEAELTNPGFQKYMQDAIGVGSGLSSFITELVNESAKLNFSIANLIVGESSEPGVINLTIFFDGNFGENIPELVTALENLNRLTNVKAVHMSRETVGSLLKVEAEIYYVEE